MLNRRDFLSTLGGAMAGTYLAGRPDADSAFATLQDSPGRRQIIAGGRRIKVVDMLRTA